MVISMLRTGLLAFLVLTGACAAEELDLASETAAVLKGTPNTTDTAVVALKTNGRFSCSGTLIAPRVVLTAAHCLPKHLQQDIPGVVISDMAIYFGDNANQDDAESIRAVDYDLASWSINQYEGDIGVIALEFAADLTPKPYATKTPQRDAAVRLIGFGANHENEQSGTGIRREGEGVIVERSSTGVDVFSSSTTICPGDSGGAGFIEENGVEVVAMVNSRGGCDDNWSSYHERVDTYVNDLIEPFIVANPAGTCDSDGVCARGCDDIDYDCPCAADGICTIECTDWPLDPDCANGPRECEADGQCVPDICKTPDPDCPTDPACFADGVCNGDCEVDPDCDDHSGNNGDDGGGCSAGTNSGPIGGTAALLFLLFFTSRRRRILKV
jgi:uncharacterized protein (TIGR03382 family)